MAGLWDLDLPVHIGDQDTIEAVEESKDRSNSRKDDGDHTFGIPKV